jgi:RNA polymerase sigma factor (sigma-70 family)
MLCMIREKRGPLAASIWSEKGLSRKANAMTREPLHTLIRHLRRAVASPTGSGPTDAQLLERFVQGRDDAAFELLVWRHGAMVLNVCLRLLHREHDAEDAFQATFLTLVRKAGTIGKRASVGSWLYKVAYRVALRARKAPAPAALPQEPLWDRSAREPATDLAGLELRSVLDEEAQRLPEKYRAAFILFHLEGQSLEAVAAALGCCPRPAGTRLARARAMLRRRLARRGFTLPALIVSASVVAALPAALVNRTVQAALLGAVEKAVAAGVISVQAAALTKGALRTMSMTKGAVVTIAVLTVSLLGSGGAFLAYRAQADEPAPAVKVAPSRAAEEAAGLRLQWRFEKNQPFYQELTTITRQTMKLQGTDILQFQNQTFVFRWTPIEQRPDKSWVLKQRIEAVKMEIQIGDTKMEFDSTKEGNANSPLFDYYKNLIGAELKVTLDKDGEVRQIEGRDELLKRLSVGNPAMYAVLMQVMSDHALRQLAATAFTALPTTTVQRGDTWVRESKLDMGPLGQYDAEYRYIYTGKDGTLDKIKVVGTLQYGPPAGDGPDLSSTIKKGKLKSNEIRGTILFDRAKGRLANLELDVELTGELTVPQAGQDTPMEVSQKQRMTLRTTDARSTKKAEAQPAENEELERLREENARLKRQLQAVEEALRRTSKPNE